MYILGVDPGLKHTGWCIVNQRGYPHGHGVIIPPYIKGRLQPEYVLRWVCPELKKVIEDYEPFFAIVEQVAYYGMRRSITLPLAHVAGGITGFLLGHGVPAALLLAAQRRDVEPCPGSEKWSEHERDAYALATVELATINAVRAGGSSTPRKPSAAYRRIITAAQTVYGKS